MYANPMMQIMAAIQSGKNPAVVLNQLARTDPQIAQAMRMINGKNPQQLREMAENMAKERGLNIEDVARSLGIAIPSHR